MKPLTTDKSGETSTNYRGKKSYYAGKKAFIKKRGNKMARRKGKICNNLMDEGLTLVTILF